MNQDLDNKINLKYKILSLIRENKIKISFLATAILIAFFIFIYLVENNKRENIALSEKYIKAGLNLSNEKTEQAKKDYEEIILGNNKFYALLAFNTILEKNLITDEKKILEYFSQLEKNSYSNEIQDLILLKKSLFLFKSKKYEAGTELLNNLIEKDSKLKSLSQEILK